MDPKAFDQISKLFSARRLSRRESVRWGGTAAASLAAGLAVRGSAAQDDATPASGTPAAGAEDANVEYLFVQSFERGTIAPKEGAAGTYTLTLDHGLGQTLYFSDRPDRTVGAAPTDAFLAGIGFPPDNPPNAAVVVETAPSSSDIAVVELSNPIYDASAANLTYDVTVLKDWEDSLAMGFAEAPTDLAQVAPSFGAAHLFIDNCPDQATYCATTDPNDITGRFLGNEGHCWDLDQFSCIMCRAKPYYVALCNQAFPDLCTDQYPCDQTYSVAGTRLDSSDYWPS